jgi:protein phosphatase
MATIGRQPWGDDARDMAGSVPNSRGHAGRVAEIPIPDPSLVVLVGAAGAGKSTFARRWFAPAEILSSDALRARLAGDPADQSVSRAAFGLLHRELTARLRAGQLTVVDATNVARPARRSLVLRARLADQPAVAIVLDLPGEAVHARNAARVERVVAAGVVDRQLAALQRSLADGLLLAEGFGAVHRLGSAAELNAVQLVRVNRPGSG